MTRDERRPDAAASWRLFVALPVPVPGATAIHDALAGYRHAYPDVRWLDPARYHVTLRFLGAVDPALVDDLAQAVSRCARESRPFTVMMGRPGGMRGRSAVAWLALHDGHERVTALADHLDELLPEAVLARVRPTRPAPHLTIARRVSASLIGSLVEDRPAFEMDWTADRIVLFRSHTGTPAGSAYEPLAEARLGERVAA